MTSNGHANRTVATQGGPCDDGGNMSLVNKIKTSVTGLLPSSLSKWFRSTETVVDDLVVVGGKKSRHRNDETFEEPPVKRLKLPESTIPARFSRTVIDSEVSAAGTSNDSDSSEESCTMATTTTVKVEVNDDEAARRVGYDIMDVIRLKDSFSSPISAHNRSLFHDRTSNSVTATSLSTRRPSFDSSAFGSPGFVDRTVATRQIMSSPFYRGRTMYGGASQSTTVDRQRAPKVRVTPVNEKSANVVKTTLSKTAQRILDTLEQYATSVDHMPNPLRNERAVRCAHPYMSARGPPNTRELQVPRPPDLLRMKLQDSTVSVRKMLADDKSSTTTVVVDSADYQNRPLANKMRVKTTRKHDEQRAQSTSTSTNLPDVPLPIANLPKFDLFPVVGDSKKRSLATVACDTLPTVVVVDKQSSNDQVDSAAAVGGFRFAEPIVLGVDDLRAMASINDFRFSEPLALLKTSNGFKVKAATVAGNVFEVKGDKGKSATGVGTGQFAFGKGVETDGIVAVGQAKPPSFLSKPNVDFSQPFQKTVTTFKETSSLEPIPTPTKLSDSVKTGASQLTSFGKPNDTNGDLSKTTFAVKSTVISPHLAFSFGGGGQKTDAGDVRLFSFGSQSSATSKTSDLVAKPTGGATLEPGNKPDVSSDAGSVKIAQVSGSETFSQALFDKFKSAGDTWECQTCLVRNKTDAIKCAACETPKTGVASTPLVNVRVAEPTPVKLTASAGFVGFQPTATDAWTCQTCLVRNERDVARCVACETPKTRAAPPTTTFKFGAQPPDGEGPAGQCRTSETGLATLAAFKPPKDSWECGVCMVRNKSDVARCVACETAKPGGSVGEQDKAAGTGTMATSATPTFTFGIFPPNSKPSSGPPPPPPPTFTFGVVTPPTAAAVQSEATNAYFTSNASAFGPPPTPSAADTAVGGFATPSFAFGKQPNVGADSKPTSGGLFAFGAAAAAAQSSGTAFGFSANRSQAEHSPFAFGKQPNVVAERPSGMFGAAASVARQNGGFGSFGAAKTSTGFDFGKSGPSTAGFNFGGNVPQTSTGGFNFGGGGVAAPTFDAAAKPMFNFSGGATPTFSAQPSLSTDSTPLGPQRRKIRAVRRNPQR